METKTMETAIKLPRAIEQFSFRIIRVIFKIHQPTRLPTSPPDRNGTLRGAFNASLTATWCKGNNQSGRPCRSCNCIYKILSGEFWPESRSLQSKFNRPPAPYLLWLPQNHSNGAGYMGFHITLFGEAANKISFLVNSLHLMARKFLGRPGSYSLERVEELDIHQVPRGIWFQKNTPSPSPPHPPLRYSEFKNAPETAPEWVELEFPRMLILQEKGIINPMPSTSLILERLLQRVSLISAAYCQSDWEPIDSHAAALSENLQTFDHQLFPISWQKRDSDRDLRPGSRRKKRVHHGLTGSCKISGKGLKAVLPLLSMGTICPFRKNARLWFW